MSKPLLLLIDGYNVISPVAGPSRSPDPLWLHHERMRLLDRLATPLSAEVLGRTCVVFDAADPPKDRPARFVHQGIDVRFAVDYPEADDLLEELIAQHHAPKQLTVVSSDHRIHAAARKRRATCFDSQPWFDAVVDGRVRLVHPPSQESNPFSSRSRRNSTPATDQEKPWASDLDADAVARWLDEFGIDDGSSPNDS